MSTDNLATLVIDSLRRIGIPECPIYESILHHSVVTAPPPFAQNWFGRRYFELATHADWFANSLVANAALEGYGARQVWKFSNRVPNETYAEAVRKHALDESRHSTMFVAMLKLVFPGATIDGATEDALQELQPRFSPTSHPPIARPPESELCSNDEVLWELVGIHITEIRALVLQYLLRGTLLAYAPSPNEDRLERFSTTLIRDEARHIAYTARIIEAEAKNGREEFLFDTFEQRLNDFNDVTMIELSRETVAI